MDELKTIYRQALPARIEALEAACAALRAGDADSETALRRIAHSLRGSGGTYGFPEISTAAAAVEQARTADVVDRVDALLIVLRDTLRGAQSG